MSIKRQQKSSKVVKSSKTYYCDVCNYTASQKSNYDKHLASKKHQKKCCENVDGVAKLLKIQVFCEFCKKEYKSRSGLWRHQQKCKFKDTVTPQKVVKPENENPYLEITKLNNQINEMKDKKIIYLQNKLEQTNQQNQQLTEMCTEFAKNKAITNNTNNTNNYNQNISIKVFLNENCKGALNLADFVQNIKVTLEDLNYTKDNGYVNGVTNIIKKQLEDMKPTERPIHCSDIKRLKFYVKENDKWEKDENNKKIDETIRDIKLKQCKTITEWENLNPTYKENPELMNEWMNILSGISEGDSGNPTKEKLTLKKRIASYIDLKYAMDNP
uniref:C2H2-type domain-containing protein n=1 Tax=viral metagenome TaxID=1070528 RepID=A0A6C0J9L6_9ZZZZ